MDAKTFDLVFSICLIVAMICVIGGMLWHINRPLNKYPKVLYPRRRIVFRKRWMVQMDLKVSESGWEQLKWSYYTRLGALLAAWRSWKLFDGAETDSVILLHKLGK